MVVTHPLRPLINSIARDGRKKKEKSIRQDETRIIIINKFWGGGGELLNCLFDKRGKQVSDSIRLKKSYYLFAKYNQKIFFRIDSRRNKFYKEENNF